MASILQLEDVFCYICRSVLIQPVRLPCQHVLCLHCFDMCMGETSYSCPMCRRRVSSWVRSGRKTGQLVDEVLWKGIQDQYPDEVLAKREGRDDGIDAKLQAMCHDYPIISSTGEVGKEYANFLKSHEEALNLQRQKEENDSLPLIEKLREEERKIEEARKAREIEEKMSLELIMRLQQEEENERVRQLQEEQKSLELIKLLQNDEKTTRRRPFVTGKTPTRRSKRCSKGNVKSASSSTTTGPMDLYTFRVKERSELENSDSRDSIGAEMNTHFKPIRCVPKTPPKSVNYNVQHPHKCTPLTVRDPLATCCEPAAPHSLIPSQNSAFCKKDVLKEINFEENSDSNPFGGEKYIPLPGFGSENQMAVPASDL